MTDIKNKKHEKETLLHITKRDAMVWWKAWIIRAVAIISALVVCGVIVFLLTGYNPIKVYVSMFEGTFGSARKVWNTVQNTAMLLCISLAVTPAFKMRFWNIGAEGQVLMGGLASAACMFYIGDKLPTPILLAIMLVTSVIAGVIWGIIPAYLRNQINKGNIKYLQIPNKVAISKDTQIIFLIIESFVLIELFPSLEEYSTFISAFSHFFKNLKLNI